MFNSNSITVNRSVVFLICFCQWIFLSVLPRLSGFGMFLLYALITSINDGFGLVMNMNFAGFVEMIIMSSAIAYLGANNLTTLFVYYQLTFQGVLFLFPRIIASLLFLGRSMLCSLASISTTSHCLVSSTNFFLPGRWNNLLLMSNCSKPVIRRQH